MAGKPDPRPAKRVKDPGLMRHLHLLRAGPCVVCGSTWNLHLHHLKRRSQGGSDERSNLRWLCAEHHQALHDGNLSEEDLALIESAQAP